MREHPGSRGTFQIDNEMLADTLKPQAAFRDLSDTVLRGSTMLCFGNRNSSEIIFGEAEPCIYTVQNIMT